MSSAVLLTLFAVFLVVAAQDKNGLLPKTWKVCKKSDKNFNTCLKTAINGAVKDLSQGNKRLGVPAIEPMHFDALTVDQGSGPVGVKLQFKNLNIHGLSRAVVDKARMESRTPETYDFDINFHVDGKVRLQGDYVSSGRVLVIPISGVGKCNLTFENFRGRLSMKGKDVTKNGEKYVDIQKTEISIDTTRLYLNFRRTNQDAVSNILNKFLNDNWKEILDDMRPAISRTFGSNIREVANSVFGKIPAAVLLPS